jgi:putative transposase
VRALVAAWPLPRPRDWTARVNRAETPKDLEALRRCANRGQPFGSATWVDRMTQRFGLESTFRPRGRPKGEGIGS